MLKVGLTGGIGSGKSYVCKIFSALGIAIYPADQQAKLLIKTNTDIKNAIISEFGPESFTDKGYNSIFIASLVFNNSDLLKKLNQIIHPFIAVDFLDWCKNHNHESYIIQEAAILFESKAVRLVDYSIVVDAPEEIRIKRVMARDHIDRESVKIRMQNQWSAGKIRSLADWIIENDDKKLILPQILNLHNQLITISNTHG
jgi:dephospho-CoA kinase